MLWPPAVISQLVVVIGQGDAVALRGTRCLPPAASTADFTASGLAPVSTQNALKAANRGGSCTCASAPAVRIATVAIRIGPSLRICLTLQGLHLSEKSVAFMSASGLGCGKSVFYTARVIFRHRA